MNQALGWTLLHFVWEGAAIALLFELILLTVREARLRYAAACIALLAMVAAFAVTLAIQAPQPAPGPFPRFAVTRTLTPPPAAESTGPSAFGIRPPAWVAYVWMAGVLLLALHRLAGWRATRRLCRAGNFEAPVAWQTRLSELCAPLCISKPVRLLESCLTEVPVVLGYFRPVILVPVGLLAGLPAEQVEYILIHELAHIARHDYLVNLMQSVVEALLFYHPAVWWISHVMRNERENCCDDLVVQSKGDARAYAAALVRVEERRAPELAMAATGGSLTRRVRRLLLKDANAAGPRGLAAPAFATAVVLLIAVASLHGDPQPQSQSQPRPESQRAAEQRVTEAEVHSLLMPMVQEQLQVKPRRALPQSADETPYRKWMNEDVAYIITDAERAAFKSLQTNEEREHFIEQFWLRRDPTPGTPANEMKEEHYRRIAYTNEHFSTANRLPGWKTDRGRVYITYGPPDEIEDHSHPANAGTVPFQQWKYRFIEGIGTNVIVEFQDPMRAGEFRMTADPSQAVMNLPPAGPSTVFTSLGDHPKVSVTVGSDRSVTIEVPLEEFKPFVIYGQLLQKKSGQNVNMFQTAPLSGSVFRRVITLEPGEYTLMLAMRNLNGEGNSSFVSFTVK